MSSLKLASHVNSTYFTSLPYLHPHISSLIVVVGEVAQSCLTLCDPVDWSPPGSSVHGILQARILEWVAVSLSIGFFLFNIFYFEIILDLQISENGDFLYILSLSFWCLSYKATIYIETKKLTLVWYYWVDCRFYTDFTSFSSIVHFLVQYPARMPCCIWNSHLLNFFLSVTALQSFIICFDLDTFEEHWPDTLQNVSQYGLISGVFS